MLFPSLVDDPSARPYRFPTEDAQSEERERLFGPIDELASWENSNDADVLGRVRAEIAKSCNGDLRPDRIGQVFTALRAALACKPKLATLATPARRALSQRCQMGFAMCLRPCPDRAVLGGQ